MHLVASTAVPSLLHIEALSHESLLALVVKLSVSLLHADHLALKVGGLGLHLKDSFILVLDQSGEVLDSLLLLLRLTLELVLAQTIVLKLLAHVDQALALSITVLVLQSIEKLLCLVGAGTSSIESVLGLSEFRSDLKMLQLELRLLITQVLDGARDLLSLCFGQVATLALLDFVGQINHSLVAFTDEVLLLLDLSLTMRT